MLAVSGAEARAKGMRCQPVALSCVDSALCWVMFDSVVLPLAGCVLVAALMWMAPRPSSTPNTVPHTTHSRPQTD